MIYENSLIPLWWQRREKATLRNQGSVAFPLEEAVKSNVKGGIAS